MSESPSAAVPETSAPGAAGHVVAAVDYAAFAAEVDALGERLAAAIGPGDLAHQRRMERWGRGCTLLGYATAWIAFNPFSALLISLGNTTRWAMVTHPVLHRAFDRLPEAPERYRSRSYARGWRRYLDWLDWLHPEAWVHEHNHLHHYHTGQVEDPDLVERNTRFIHRWPRPLRWLVGAFVLVTWKLSYYAPNTFWSLKQHRRIRAQSAADARANPLPSTGEVERWAIPGEKVWLPVTAWGLEYWARCVLPYAMVRFGLLPALFLPLGTGAWAAVLANSLLAEALANLHTFLIIGPNHTGADVPRFSNRCRGKAEFYVQQVTGTVNYPGGSDWKDFWQGYLNYQIEHHVWPDLPMLKYRQAAPELKAICRRHGVPYVEEPVLRRFAHTWAVMMGEAEPPRIDTSRRTVAGA
jgi:fatty acid desaturase